MKYSIIATLVLLSSPAFASSDAQWDCGNTIMATAGKGQFGFYMGKQYEGGYPSRGILKWDLRRDGSVWVNGRRCKRSN